MNETVSIIVPVYNGESYLEQCIESLIHQTYQKLEIMLVNDGSTDHSGDICERYREKDDRIKVIHNRNGGLSDARNAGLAKVTGDYILFMDSDDYAEDNLVEEVLIIAQANQADIVVYGYYSDRVDDEEKLIESVSVVPPYGNYDLSTFHTIPVDDALINLLGYASNKLYRAELILENHFTFVKGISLVEDVLFNVPVLKKAQKITFVNKTYFHYLQRDKDSLGKKSTVIMAS